MTRFVSGAFLGGAVGFGVWHFAYPEAPNGWHWIVGGALAFGVLHAWFGHRLLDVIADWLWYRS